MACRGPTAGGCERSTVSLTSGCLVPGLRSDQGISLSRYRVGTVCARIGLVTTATVLLIDTGNGTAGNAPGAGASDAGNGLPVTGTNIAIIAVAGLVVLLTGVGLLLIRRRRIAFTVDD